MELLVEKLLAAAVETSCSGSSTVWASTGGWRRVVSEENGSVKSPPGPRSRGRGGRAAAARRGCGRRGAVDEVLDGS